MALLSLEQEAEKVALLLNEAKAANLWDDTKHDEYALRRCLNARDWDVANAKTLWSSIVHWRKQWDVDTMLKRQILTPSQEQRFRELFPHGLHGVDRLGRPVLIYRIGKANCTALMEEFPELTRQQVHAQLMEFVTRVAMPACSVAFGKRIDRMTTLYDLTDVHINKASAYGQLLTPPTRITGAYYPDFLAQLLVANAPMVFDTLFAVSKRMLAPATQKKIIVLGHRATASSLSDHIALDQLPKFLGGTSDRSITENWGPWTDMPAEELPAMEEHMEDAGPLHIDDVAVTADKICSPEYFAATASNRFTKASTASFHTCLSGAESAFLRSFLAAPSAARGFTPGLGATMRQRDVPTIREESHQTHNSLRVDSRGPPTPSTTKSNAPKKSGCCPWLCGGGGA